MNVLKWFKQNLCTYEEFIASETPEEKIIAGEELFNQMYRLAEMEVYAFLREKNTYIWPGRVYRFANRLIKVYHINIIYRNEYYKIRLKDGLNLEEYGVKAVHFEPAYPQQKPKKKRRGMIKLNEKGDLNTIKSFLTKPNLSHNEFIKLIKIIYNRSNNFVVSWNFKYRDNEITIPGKFFIRGKEFPEIKLLIPSPGDYDFKKWQNRNIGFRKVYDNNTFNTFYLSATPCVSFEMCRDGWLCADNFWNDDYS